MSHPDQRQLPNPHATTVMVAIGVGVVQVIMVGYVCYRRATELLRLADASVRQVLRNAEDDRRR